MRAPKLPRNYVEAQRECNRLHSNGRVENDDEIEFILDFAEWVEEGGIVFDSALIVGCRTGYEVSALKAQWPSALVLGVDIVPEFVQYANRHGRPALQADMHALPFADGLFDLVLCIGTLEHAYNARKAAKELLRVARRAVFCDAELNAEKANSSNFTFVSSPETWVEMFYRSLWRLDWRGRPESTYIWAYKDKGDYLDLSKLRGTP